MIASYLLAKTGVGVGDYLECTFSFRNTRFSASAPGSETGSGFRIVKESRSNARARMTYNRQIINDVISNAVFMVQNAKRFWEDPEPRNCSCAISHQLDKEGKTKSPLALPVRMGHAGTSGKRAIPPCELSTAKTKIPESEPS